MRRPLVRVMFLVICAVLLLYGMRYERHEVFPLARHPNDVWGSGIQYISGPAFVEGATVDAYMRKDGQMYDVGTLSEAPVQAKDCKT